MDKQNLKNGMDSKAMDAFDIYVESQFSNTPERRKAWNDFGTVVVGYSADEMAKTTCGNP